MTPHPSSHVVDRLRSAAKQLKKAFAAGDAAAIARLRAQLPDAAAPKHADFLHAIAREHGHDSWPKLKFAIEAARLTRTQRAERLARALFHGQHWRVRKLLRDEPDLAGTDFALQLATYDIASVRQVLAKDPAAATRPIRGRTPILHLAFSKYIHMVPEKRGAMLEVAELVLRHGADVNDGYAATPGSAHRLSALYGALGHAGNMPLAEWLLQHGARPDDGESLYHATELGHHDGLRLLIRHGVATRGTNALLRALDFDDQVSVRLLLEHGADPNEVVAEHASGEPVETIPALHQAARRWCSPGSAALLLDHGADPAAIWHGHTAFSLACIFGNRRFADALASRGAAMPLSATEAVLAACASGEAPSQPLDRRALDIEDQRLIGRLIFGPVPLSHIRALVAAGIDPDMPNETGLTPLHLAGWEGLPDRVAYLLTLGADLAHRNMYGGNALEATLHGAEFCPHAQQRDHLGCVRLLLQAGAVPDAADIDACGNEEIVEFLADWQAERPAGAATG